MTVFDGRAPRSAVIKLRKFHSFITFRTDGGMAWKDWACRYETLLTPERLRT